MSTRTLELILTMILAYWLSSTLTEIKKDVKEVKIEMGIKDKE